MKKSMWWALAGFALTLVGYIVDGKTQDQQIEELRDELKTELLEEIKK